MTKETKKPGSSFFSRNKDRLVEDAGQRDGAGILDKQYEGRKRLDKYSLIRCDRIEADPQHREQFDEAETKELAESLKAHGQILPIYVRWDADREIHIIIAGERRYRAAVLAGFESVECKIAPVDITVEQILTAQLIENLQRKDLKPSEKAKAFRDKMKQSNLTATELAAELKINKSTISRLLKVLEWPAELQQRVDAGELSVQDAIKLSKASNSEGATLTAKPKKKRRTREHKITVDGFTITIKARRILDDELVVKALQSALAKMEQPPAKMAA